MSCLCNEWPQQPEMISRWASPKTCWRFARCWFSSMSIHCVVSLVCLRRQRRIQWCTQHRPSLVENPEQGLKNTKSVVTLRSGSLGWSSSLASEMCFEDCIYFQNKTLALLRWIPTHGCVIAVRCMPSNHASKFWFNSRTVWMKLYQLWHFAKILKLPLHCGCMLYEQNSSAT